MNSVVKPGIFARATVHSALVVLLSWIMIQLGVSPVQAEGTVDEPTVDAAATINVDTFVGGDYAEFWWDSSQIAGCSYVTVKRDGTGDCSGVLVRREFLQGYWTRSILGRHHLYSLFL